MNAKEAAQSLLDYAWSSDVFPVDPVQIAKKLEISVVQMKLSEGVSGALIKESGGDPVIVLSELDGKNRQRFSCAHELGHYAHRLINDADHYEYIDLRSELSETGSNAEEIYANEFAANLLMPDYEVKKLYKKMPFFLLISHFGVSESAMTFRLKNLGLS